MAWRFPLAPGFGAQSPAFGHPGCFCPSSCPPSGLTHPSYWLPPICSLTSQSRTLAPKFMSFHGAPHLPRRSHFQPVHLIQTSPSLSPTVGPDRKREGKKLGKSACRRTQRHRSGTAHGNISDFSSTCPWRGQRRE